MSLQPDKTVKLRLRSKEGRRAYVAGMEQALRLAHNASDLPSFIKSLQGAVKLAREIAGLEGAGLPWEITLDPPEVLCLKVGGDGPGANVETVRKGARDIDELLRQNRRAGRADCHLGAWSTVLGELEQRYCAVDLDAETEQLIHDNLMDLL